VNGPKQVKVSLCFRANPTPQHSLLDFKKVLCALLIPHTRAQMAFAKPRPSGAPATPTSLFLQRQLRVLVYFLPELIYAVVVVLILFSLAVFVRAAVCGESRDFVKARNKGIDSLGCLCRFAHVLIMAANAQKLSANSFEFELSPRSRYSDSPEYDPWQGSSSSSDRHGFCAHTKRTEDGMGLLSSRGAVEKLDCELGKEV
jgi:hypothetical protein